MSLKKINYYLALLLLGSSVVFVSCGNDDDEEELLGDWEKVSDFDGVKRSEAVSFVVGKMGYLATGYNDDERERLRDLWAYNSDENYWTQKADLPDGAKARSAAVAFAAAGKGYVGTGVDDNGDRLKDFWAYNPTTDSWSAVTAEFPGVARYSAVAFGIGDNGYVGTGSALSGETKDFYKYSPASNSWEQIAFPGSKKLNAAAFVIGTKAYLVTGTDNQVYLSEFYEFDSATQKWTRLRDIANTNSDEKYDDDYTSIVRTGAVAFAINGKGYLATGSSVSAVNNVWEYNPSTDLWEEKTGFERTSRSEAVGFAIGDYGYVATGRSSGAGLDDLVRFDPKAEQNDYNNQ